MPRLTLSLPAELGPTRGRTERGRMDPTERAPRQIGPGQRAEDELAARTVRWLACWAGK